MYHLIRSLYLHATSKEEYSILLLGLDNAGKTTLLNQIKALYSTSTSTSAPATAFPGTSSSITSAKPDPGDGTPSATAGDTVPTVGQNVVTIDLPNMYIKIWDVGGQMTLRRLWTSYYKSCHAVVFVVDSTDLGMLEPEAEPSTPSVDGMLSPNLQAGPRTWHGRRKSSYAVPQDHDGTDSSEKPPQTPITPSMISGAFGQGRLDECKAVLENVLGHPDTSGVPVLVLANKQDREDSIEVVRIKEGFVRPVFEGEKGAMVRDSRVLPISALKGTGVKEAVEWVRSRVLWNKNGRPPVMR
ncbi:ADP-ribosylation factor protein 3 [Neophaeococcomyces mojaviensis]|uniref:ADP-ribosylation factor protein 3 n=1 Tax=Neophaeococcomyces mojaviensis TaxID=3383035 RepID=A0ACC2ZWZ5_9EURO|nr:ADP-ribosylation factor protein 3 [Knufia sp. JES_112]